jgi:predicted choloylglycine hydrolase
MPFNDHTISQLKDRLIKHQNITDFFSSLLSSGRDLVKSQTGSFLKLARFYTTDLSATTSY